MPYPFVQNMRNMEDAAYKLKVLSVAMKEPISKVAARAIEKAFEEYEGKEGLVFKQEPGILHICCKEIDVAENILNKARLAGWKNSGIMSLAGRIVLELRSTEHISLPIYEKGLLVDDKFLKILVKEANKKLEKSWEKINNLEKVI